MHFLIDILQLLVQLQGNVVCLPNHADSLKDLVVNKKLLPLLKIIDGEIFFHEVSFEGKLKQCSLDGQISWND